MASSPTGSPTKSPQMSILDDYDYMGDSTCTNDAYDTWNTIHIEPTPVSNGECATDCEALTPTKLGYRGFFYDSDTNGPVCRCIFDSYIDVDSVVAGTTNSAYNGYYSGPITGVEPMMSVDTMQCWSYKFTTTMSPTTAPTASPTQNYLLPYRDLSNDFQGSCQFDNVNYLMISQGIGNGLNECASKCYISGYTSYAGGGWDPKYRVRDRFISHALLTDSDGVDRLLFIPRDSHGTIIMVLVTATLMAIQI